MDWVIPKLLVGNSEISLQFPGRRLHTAHPILIRGEDWNINKALALSAFGFPDRAIQETGCRVQFLKKPHWPKDYRNQYVSSNSRAEISGYWNTVMKEITLDGTALFEKSSHLESVIEVLGLGNLINRHPKMLSGGETAKMIIASHLAMQPSILVLDRIVGQLDIHSRSRLISHVKCVLPDGILVAIDDVLSGIYSEVWLVGSETILIEECSSIADTSDSNSALESDILQFESVFFCQKESTDTEFIVRELELARDGRIVFDVSHLEAKSGTFVWILGKNGAGKTSFLEACIGWLAVNKGSVIFSVEGKKKRAENVVAYSPQEPESDVTETTMFAEIELSRTVGDRNNRCSTGDWLTKLGLAETHMFYRIADDIALQKLASVLSALSRGRPFCFLDEPTASLPGNMRNAVVLAIADYLSGGGIVLCATHDMSFYREIFKERDRRFA